MLTKKFQSQSAAVASYSYSDIASGTGVVKFYGAKALSGANYILTTDSTVYSENVLTWSAVSTSATYIKLIDADFDVILNMPRIIKGTFYANVPFGIRGTTAQSAAAYVKVFLRKVSSGSETTIISGTGKIYEAALSVGGFEFVMDNLSMTAPSTNYKKNDTLRVTIEVYGRSVDDPAEEIRVLLGHEPTGRVTSNWDTTQGGAPADFTFGTDPSVLVFHVPFVIDL